MLKKTILFLIFLTSLFINFDNLDPLRFFSTLGLFLYLDKVEFTFEYWLFLHLVFLSMFVYSILNIIKHNFLGVFGKGFRFENKNQMFMFLGIYILTVANIYIYGLSKRFRKELKNKVGEFGGKGKRGTRGTKGDISSCEDGCGDVSCFNKMMDHLTKIFNEELENMQNYDSKIHNKILDGEKLKNNFIKNKCRKMCDSEAMRKMITDKGIKRTYNYLFYSYKDGKFTDDLDMKKTWGPGEEDEYYSLWRQWFIIILSYKEGYNFLVSEEKTDNDFDYDLSNEEDRIVSINLGNDEINNINKRDLSPFDIIKRYDAWYWGSSKNAFPSLEKTIPTDDVGTKYPALKISNSNIYRVEWESEKAKILKNNSEYINECCSGETKIYNDLIGFSRSNIPKSVVIYRAQEIPVNGFFDTFKPLGDTILIGGIDCHKKNPEETRPNDLVLDYTNVNNDVEGNPKDLTKLITFNKNDSSALEYLKPAIGFRLLYFSSIKREHKNNEIEIQYPSFSLWRPLAPEGYISLGDVMSSVVYKDKPQPPNTNLFYCVHKDLIKNKGTRGGESIWIHQKDLIDTSDIYFHKYYDPTKDINNFSPNFSPAEAPYIKKIIIKKNPHLNTFKVYSYTDSEIGNIQNNNYLDENNYAFKFKDQSSDIAEFIVPEKHSKDYSINKIYEVDDMKTICDL